MKAGITVNELAGRIQNVMTARKDLIVPSAALRFNHDENADTLRAEIAAHGEFEMTNLFTQQVNSHIGLPTVYSKRLDTEDKHLLAYSVNRLLGRYGDRRTIRTLQNGSKLARAFLSDRYRRLDNEQVLEQIIPALGAIPGLQITECELTENRMYIKAVTPRIAGEVKVGDHVQAGLVISNSEVGAGALNISPLVYRLVCLNGLIVPDAKFRAFHLGKRAAEGESVYELLTDETRAADDKALLLKARDVAAGIFNQDFFDGLLTKMRASTEEQLKTKRPDLAVQVLADQIGLNETEQVSVLTHLLSGGDFSRWGFTNAVTAMAQEVPSYDRSVQLEALGSKVMTLPNKEWRALEAAA